MTPTAPPDWVVNLALATADQSPCRSKRGVVIYADGTGRSYWHAGLGHNGPPDNRCPGRDACAGRCGEIAVHAEMRALLSVRADNAKLDLVHVELAPDGGVVACSGPRCAACSKHIADCGFVDGVWLYEMGTPPDEIADAARRGIACLMRPFWRRYSAAEFHAATLARCGLPQ